MCHCMKDRCNKELFGENYNASAAVVKSEIKNNK